MKTKTALQLAFVACCAFTLCTDGLARPPGPPLGGPGPGFRPGPGPGGPGPGFRPGPGPRPPRHHWGADVLGGALAIGLGLGVAGAIANSVSTPPPTTVYVPPTPTYVPPNYIVPSAPVVVSPPAVVAPHVVVAPPVTVTPSVGSGNVMYWCQASKNFYPYVTECPSGWQATTVP